MTSCTDRAVRTGSVKVSDDEAGQKLLRFLARRLDLPDTMLHRWIRQGQVRLNGHRTKPFIAVQTGDEVRLPPFAFKEAERTVISALPPLPPLAASFPDFLVFNKPAGLPVHGGTGHQHSLAATLEAHFAANAFTPTLAHRLDRDTSGLIIAALSYTALRRLHETLASRSLVKEYLAWSQGNWPESGVAVLRHRLEKKMVNGRELVCVAKDGKEAVTLVSLLRKEAGASLLHIKILTGRTHQIRAQLAARGYPVLGDLKYGARPPGGLFLHAARIIMPDGTILECLPPWEGARAVKDLPPFALDKV